MRRLAWTLPPYFLKVLILIGDKVVCFHALLKVLILQGVTGRFSVSADSKALAEMERAVSPLLTSPMDQCARHLYTLNKYTIESIFGKGKCAVLAPKLVRRWGGERKRSPSKELKSKPPHVIPTCGAPKFSSLLAPGSPVGTQTYLMTARLCHPPRHVFGIFHRCANLFARACSSTG